MTDTARPVWRILLVEDNKELARSTASGLERRSVSSRGERAKVDVVTTFDTALNQIRDRRYDLIVLDIRDQAAAAVAESEASTSGDDVTPADKGLQVYTEIRRRRFIPIIFYSAVAHLAADQHDPPFVTVVNKLEEEETALRNRVVEVFDSPLPPKSAARATC